MNRFILTTIFALLFSVAFAFNSDDVTMVSYEQSWRDGYGTISLKNNTKEEIRNVTFEITYLDMKGNPLDYEKYTRVVNIEPGKSRKTNIPAYEHSRSYHYYKSEGLYDNTSFNIKYELKGYNSTDVDDDTTSEYSFANKFVSDNSSTTDQWIGIGLILFMVLFALGVTVGFYVLVAVLAKNRHRNVLLWVLLSILVSPVVIAIILLVIGKANDYEDAEEIQ